MLREPPETEKEYRESIDAIEENSNIEEDVVLRQVYANSPRNKVLVWCKSVMIFSLLAAVFCLTAYGITTTLGP